MVDLLDFKTFFKSFMYTKDEDYANFKNYLTDKMGYKNGLLYVNQMKNNSSLEIYGLNDNYDKNSIITFRICLTAPSNYSNQMLYLFDNGNLVGKYVTDSNGFVDVEIGGLSDGLHNISCVFRGNEDLNLSVINKDISVGYKLDVISCPEFIYNKQSINVSVLVSDYLNVPVPNVSVTPYNSLGGFNSSYSVKTNGNGVANIILDYNVLSNIIISDNDFYGIKLYFEIKYDELNYRSEVMNIEYYTVDIQMSANKTMTTINDDVDINIKLVSTRDNAPYNSIPVKLTGGITGNYTPNGNGEIFLKYDGESRGDVNITSSINNVSKNILIEDVIQYWKAPSTFLNRAYDVDNGTLSTVSNGFKYSSNTNSFNSFIFDVENKVRVDLDIISLTGNMVFINKTYDTVYTIPSQVTNNSHMYINVVNNELQVYLNNTDVLHQPITDNKCRICLTGTNNALIFNNFKIKRT